MVANAKTNQHGNSTFRVSTGVAVLSILVHLLLANGALSVSVRGPSANNQFKNTLHRQLMTKHT